jgi:hypothetical protein
MKKLTYLFTAVLIGLAISCSKENTQENSPASSNQTVTQLRSSECCVAEPEHQFANLLHENGPYAGAVVGTIEVWNDNSNVYVKVTSPCEFDALQCYIGACAGMPTASSGYGNYVDPTGKVTTYTYTFANTYTACSSICIGARVNGQTGQGSCYGGIASGTMTHVVKDICENTCETGMTGTAVSCGIDREANYCFTSANATHIKIQGGLTNFTGADAIVTVTGGSNVTISQVTPGNSTNRVVTVEADLGACEEICINVRWRSSNPSDAIITGDWSAKDPADNTLGWVAGLSCN